MNQQLQSLKQASKKYLDIVNRNQVFIVLLIASSVLIYTLIQSQTFIDPPRDESRYDEEIVKINYATIDQDVVDEISATLEDQDIDVDPNFVPGRNNPFAE